MIIKRKRKKILKMKLHLEKILKLGKIFIEKLNYLGKLVKGRKSKIKVQEKSRASMHDKNIMRKKINQVLERAKKSHEKETINDKMVMVRPRAQNLDKSISLVRIMDNSHVNFNA